MLTFSPNFIRKQADGELLPKSPPEMNKAAKEAEAKLFPWRSKQPEDTQNAADSKHSAPKRADTAKKDKKAADKAAVQSIGTQRAQNRLKQEGAVPAEVGMS